MHVSRLSTALRPWQLMHVKTEHGSLEAAAKADLTVKYAHRPDPDVVHTQGHMRVGTLGLHPEPACVRGMRASCIGRRAHATSAYLAK